MPESAEIVQLIAEKLRSVKDVNEFVDGIKSISLDTNGDYLLDFRQSDNVVFPKEQVEKDVDGFVDSIINQTYVIENGSSEVVEHSENRDDDNVEDIGGGDEAELVESETRGTESV